MINDLRIKNIGVIEEVSLELAKGFTVLTGETGAGKTMILTAFQMICGDKVDNGYIRSNEKSANVEAFLLIDPNNKNIERLNMLQHLWKNIKTLIHFEILRIHDVYL